MNTENQTWNWTTILEKVKKIMNIRSRKKGISEEEC